MLKEATYQILFKAEHGTFERIHFCANTVGFSPVKLGKLCLARASLELLFSHVLVRFLPHLAKISLLGYSVCK